MGFATTVVFGVSTPDLVETLGVWKIEQLEQNTNYAPKITSHELSAQSND